MVDITEAVHQAVDEFTKDRLEFTTLEIRDKCRQMHPDTKIEFRDVFYEIFMYFAKGNFKRPYHAKPVQVSLPDGNLDFTVRYTPDV